MTITQREFLATRRSDRVNATPRARRSLAQRQIDASKLKGRGPGGRILEADVLEYVASAPQAAAPGGVSASVEYLRAEIDATRLDELQTKFLPYIQKKGGVFSLNDVLLKALSESLPSYSELGGDIALYTENGKMLPVLSGEKRLNLLEIAQRREELIGKASVEGASQQSAAIALFNSGQGRVDEWTPSLSPNYKIALGVGSVAKRPVVIGDELKIRPTLRLCLAYDADQVSRLIVGGLLEQILAFLEEPESLVFA